MAMKLVEHWRRGEARLQPPSRQEIEMAVGAGGAELLTDRLIPLSDSAVVALEKAAPESAFEPSAGLAT